MADRPVIVRSGENGSSVAMFAIVAVVAVAILAALMYWQPWNSPAQRNSTTIITQPANPVGQAGGANSGSSSGGSQRDSSAGQ